MDLESLPASTVRLIGSSQVITSVYSVVKELIENAFDAQSTSVDIKLENYGLDKVEVRDNGTGIKQCNIPLVAKRYHTSKISSFSDLEKLITYGFRGEALGSLCAVSDLSITSKTPDEEISQCVTFDHHGNVLSTLPSHLGQGTTICATHLFKNMPVRRQFYNTVKKKKEELKKLEDLLMWYGAIRPDIRLTLRHGKDFIWQKNLVPDVRASLLGIMGRSVVTQLEHRTAFCEESEVSMEAYFPKPHSDFQVTSRSTPDRCFIAVNKRPVFLKEVDKVIRQHYCQHHACENRYPVYYLSICCPSSQLDVNLDPNKTRVMLHNQAEIMAKLIEILEELYGPITKSSQSGANTERSLTPLNELDQDDSLINSRMDKENSDYTSIKIPVHCVSDNDRVSEIDKTVGDFENVLETGKQDKPGKCSSEQVRDINSSGHTLPGFRISFYDKLNVNTSSERTDGLQTGKNTDLDSNENVVKDTNLTESAGEKTSETGNQETMMDCDLVLTQGAKGNFELVDDDLDCMLATQSDEKPDSNDKAEDMMIASEVQKKEMNRTNTVSFNDELSDRDKLAVPDSEEWSKGQRKQQTDGQVLEPVKLLVPDLLGSNKRPPSPSGDKEFQTLTPPSKKRVPNAQVDQPRIYECVVSNNSDKYSSGFVAFSKEIRPKVVEENPSADYDTITKMVQEKWAKLSDTNKQHFCMVGKEELLVLKKTVVEKKKLSQKIKPKSTVQVKPGLPTIKDQLLAASKTNAKASPQIKSVRTSFSLDHLKQLYNTGIRESQTQLGQDLRLIGPLKFYNAWVCCHGNKIQLLNPHRVEETLLHRDLLDKHVLPSSTLENPIRLTKSNLGEDLYQTLLTLFPSNSHSHTYTMVDDDRLVANGIQVRQHVNQDCEPVLDLVGMCQVMPLYGVSDLSEILELICHTKTTSLSMARPLKVINYLQSEAVRMVRQRPLHRSRDEMLDLVEQMSSSLPDNMTHCLHNKPFLNDLHDMKTVLNQSLL